MRDSEPLQVIYDGHCALCRASMKRIQAMLGERVSPVDFRSVPPEQIHPELREESCKARMHLLDGEKLYGGAEAMVRILQLHRGYRLIVWLYYLPPIGWLAERMYEYVARNRFRLSKWLGSDVPECTDACSIHRKD
ncbi:thiol-disulfide oxidoreductase DCC family protein [Tumebacillus lipolyticus]|uniref:Thiol-disulfide oxidoreductase DCC family protein n=1 Tax=Tumebacillus lipolyticus TaxID=1280370 RepID=A0ABW4ZUN5_9BACL